jgi:hypothetical protein
MNNMLEMMYDEKEKLVKCWNGDDIIEIPIVKKKANCDKCNKKCFFWEDSEGYMTIRFKP